MSLNVLLPNLVSLSRLALTPFIAHAILRGNFSLALVIFLAAAATDSVDGYLARRLHAESRFGAYVDPVTDKIFLSTIYVCLWVAEVLPGWLVAIVFGRDVIMLVLICAVLLFTTVRSFPPSIWGKLSTFVQIVTAVTVMTARAYPAEWRDQAAAAVIWCAAATTIWSGTHYIWRGMGSVRRAKRQEK